MTKTLTVVEAVLEGVTKVQDFCSDQNWFGSYGFELCHNQA